MEATVVEECHCGWAALGACALCYKGHSQGMRMPGRHFRGTRTVAVGRMEGGGEMAWGQWRSPSGGHSIY